MAIPTVRMPDDTHDRLRHLAKARKVSMNKLIEAFSIAALAEFDAEARFRARAARGNPRRSLQLLAKLDEAEAFRKSVKIRGRVNIRKLIEEGRR